ncbi:MAG: hypothetical protein LBS75_03920, partial [Synergistaceae bacterium]|nr:hypothetical protein [Synergistaceae bacterium]
MVLVEKHRRLFSFIGFIAAILFMWGVSADANILYTTVDASHSNGSAGVIEAGGSPREIVSVLGGDPQAGTFKDHNGKWRIFLANSEMSKNDEIMVFDPDNWKEPIINKRDWGVSIQGVASLGDYLYVIAYASGTDGSGPGGVFRFDMRDGYRARGSSLQTESNGILPVGDAITAVGDNIYALFSQRSGTYTDGYTYNPSQIIVYDKDLKIINTIVLRKESDSASNTYGNTLAADSSGNLYVASSGGDYDSPHGSVWKVEDPAGSATVTKILDVLNIPVTGDPLPSVDGIEIAPDGTLFLLVDNHNWENNKSTLFITRTGDPKWENEFTSPGSRILYDNGSLWCITPSGLDERAKDGEIKKSYTTAQLGDTV